MKSLTGNHLNRTLSGFVFFGIGMIALFAAVVIANDAKAVALIDPALKAFASQRAPMRSGPEATTGVKKARIIFLVRPSGQTVAPPQRYDRAGVIRYYQQVSRQAVQPILQAVQNHQLEGVELRKAYWINAALLADVTPQGLMTLAQNPSVTKIYSERQLQNDPGRSGGARRPFGLGEAQRLGYDMTSLGMDKLNEEFPQINGQGVLVGVEDSGVSGGHPALQGRVALFYNGQTRSVTQPQDFDVQSSHGTHVCGTIAGGDRKNAWIGMAPGAKLVVAATVEEGIEGELDGMQWVLDAQNNPAVASRIKVINNSWKSEGAPDQEVFYRALAAWEAAGILPVFSAGNAGESGPRTITHPHEYPGVVAVGAYGPDGRVASFSSRGPALFQGKEVQKPDLLAPGVNIVSSIAGGGFGSLDGTSMASPHVTGAVALLLQVNPNFNPQQIRQLLLQSVTPGPGLSPGQWSPDYGFGTLNVYNAVKLALQRTMQLRGMSLNAMTMGLTGPEKTDLQLFAEASLGEVGGPVDQYPQTDASAWWRPSLTDGVELR